MSISFRIQAGQGAATPSAANTVARLGVCANADPANTIYQFDPGQDVLPALRGGPLAVDAAYASTWGGAAQVAVKVPATTPGAISAVTKPGGDTSPTPTVVGSAFDSVANSPYDAFDVRLRYSTGGAPGTAIVDVALDGATYAYTYPMPPALPATLRGTTNLAGGTWDWADLTGTDFAFTPDTALAALKASTPSSTSIITVLAGAGGMLTAGLASLALTPRPVTITTGGTTPADAPATAVLSALDEHGANFTETITISQVAGTVRSTHRVSVPLSLVYAAGQGTGATLTLGIGGDVAVTFTTVSNEAEALAYFTDPALVARIVQVGDARYMEISGLVLGTSGTLVSLGGSAADVLGFDLSTATGINSTLTIPGTGLAITFPVTSPYEARRVHSFATSAPTHSKADFDAALAALNADLAIDFGLVELVQEPADATALAAYVADTDATGAAWEAQESKRFVHFLVPAPSGATDLVVRNALTSQQSRYTTSTARWIYQDAVRGLPSGSFPRSAVRPLATRCAAVSMSEDPGFAGFGPLPGCSMRGPDGVTKAPDESTATVKLGTSRGPGYTVIKGKAENGKLLPYFVRGVTRAGQSSLFVDLGVTRMVARAGAIIYASLQKIENLTLDLMPEGTIQEHDAVTYEDTFLRALTGELVPNHASAAVVTIDRAEVVSSTRNITVNYQVQERGQGEWITATLTLVGQLVVDGQTVGG